MARTKIAPRPRCSSLPTKPAPAPTSNTSSTVVGSEGPYLRHDGTRFSRSEVLLHAAFRRARRVFGGRTGACPHVLWSTSIDGDFWRKIAAPLDWGAGATSVHRKSRGRRIRSNAARREGIRKILNHSRYDVVAAQAVDRRGNGTKESVTKREFLDPKRSCPAQGPAGSPSGSRRKRSVLLRS